MELLQKIAAAPFWQTNGRRPIINLHIGCIAFSAAHRQKNHCSAKDCGYFFIGDFSKFRLTDYTSFTLQSQILSKITTFKINVVASIIFEKTYLLSACQFKTKTF